jgi:hypothetical protein
MRTSLKESAILRQVEDYLNAKRLFWGRLNTGRIFMNGRVFQAHSFGSGCADLVIPATGTIWLETKVEGKDQSLAQKFFERTVLERGHRYRIVRSVDDLEGWL